MPPFRAIVFAVCGLALSAAGAAHAQTTGCGQTGYQQIEHRLADARAAARSAGCTGLFAMFRGQACYGLNARVAALEAQLAQAARSRPQPQPAGRAIFQPLFQERLVVPDCVQKPRAQTRVVCVRLCDGYYFPVNHRISQKNLPKDEQKCLGQYPQGAAALYIDRSGGENIATMVSLDGKTKYGDQAFAFAFQKSFNPNCPRPGANLVAADAPSPPSGDEPAAAVSAAASAPAVATNADDVRRVGPPFAYYLPEPQDEAALRADAAPAAVPEKVDVPLEPVVATRVDERVQ